MDYIFKDLDMSGLILSNVDAHYVRFINCDMSRMYINNVNFTKCQLANCDLKSTILSNANMSGARLENVDFSHSAIKQVDMCRTLLNKVNFTDAVLYQVNFEQSNITGDVILDRASIDRATFSLVTVKQDCLVGLDTVNCLQNVVGDGELIKTIVLPKWVVTITPTHMQIGCQYHPIDQWWKFTDEEINAMAPEALLWWSRWKSVIKQVAANY